MHIFPILQAFVLPVFITTTAADCFRGLPFANPVQAATCNVGPIDVYDCGGGTQVGKYRFLLNPSLQFSIFEGLANLSLPFLFSSPQWQPSHIVRRTRRFNSRT